MAQKIHGRRISGHGPDPVLEGGRNPLGPPGGGPGLGEKQHPPPGPSSRWWSRAAIRKETAGIRAGMLARPPWCLPFVRGVGLGEGGETLGFVGRTERSSRDSQGIPKDFTQPRQYLSHHTQHWVVRFSSCCERSQLMGCSLRQFHRRVAAGKAARSANSCVWEAPALPGLHRGAESRQLAFTQYTGPPGGRGLFDGPCTDSS
jgi:hypothetical protein